MSRIQGKTRKKRESSLDADVPEWLWAGFVNQINGGSIPSVGFCILGDNGSIPVPYTGGLGSNPRGCFSFLVIDDLALKFAFWQFTNNWVNLIISI